jgi:hypothetical protein
VSSPDNADYPQHKVGQLVRIIGGPGIGDIGQVSHQRGTTEECGHEPPYERVYVIWRLATTLPSAHKHSELEAVKIVRDDENCDA